MKWAFGATGWTPTSLWMGLETGAAYTVLSFNLSQFKWDVVQEQWGDHQSV